MSMRVGQFKLPAMKNIVLTIGRTLATTTTKRSPNAKRTHTHTFAKVLQNHFIFFHFAIGFFLSCFGYSLFCITKFHSRVSYQKSSMCGALAADSHRTYVAHHSIQFRCRANYLHKRELRFTTMNWMYNVHRRASTPHDDDDDLLSCVSKVEIPQVN